jgi:predicted DCC family thiol-disulfide oxidoreductase YuxK
MDPVTDLPDPDQRPEADVVIFDGKCQFCQQQVRRLAMFDKWGKWLGQSGKLSYISLHDPRVGSRYPNLSHDDLMRQMYVVQASGEQHGGADAIRYLSRRLPALWVAAPVLHIPGSARLWRWMYGKVAQQRYRWNRDECENDACAIHFSSNTAGSPAGRPSNDKAS